MLTQDEFFFKRVVSDSVWRVMNQLEHCILDKIFKKKQEISVLIPDFGVSTPILNHAEIFRRWCKLNFGLLRGHVTSRHFSAILLKDRPEETIFLLFKRISWNTWQGTTLTNPLIY